MKKRKDQLGKNTFNTLNYYSGVANYLLEDYENLSIHGKIAVRTLFSAGGEASVILDGYIIAKNKIRIK